MKMQEYAMFAYATRGEALEVANAAVEDLCVAAVQIIGAERPVAWLVMRSGYFAGDSAPAASTGSSKE
jgi:hypothetical protein